MKRIYPSFKHKKTKTDVIKQAQKLRAQMMEEHGDIFKELQQHAEKMHNGPAMSSDAAPSAPPQEPAAHMAEGEKLDAQKNIRTILKFIDGHVSTGREDVFAKKIFDMIREKQRNKKQGQ